MPRLNVAALIAGEPHATELWTLRRLCEVSGRVTVIRAERGTGLSTATRLRRLVREHGVLAVASRIAAGRTVGRVVERREQDELDRLFDGDDLRRWWQASGIQPVDVPHLNHQDARAAIAALAPDIIVRVSGGILGRGTFGLAGIAAINIHHGIAPRIRGMWSIPWGIVEARPEWIGATVHRIDDGIDTGTVFWRGSPQISPGDTATTLFMRAHLEAVDALARVLGEYDAGRAPAAVTIAPSEPSAYRSAPGLGAWARFVWLGRGKRCASIVERAVRC